MQTDSIRNQARHILLAILVASFFTYLWHQLFQNKIVFASLSFINVVLLFVYIFLGLYTERPIDIEDQQQIVNEDLTNPADLWIWPVVQDDAQVEQRDLKSFDLDDSEQMMAWLELLMIEEDLALKGNGDLSWVQAHHRGRNSTLNAGSVQVDLILFSILLWLVGLVSILWLKFGG